MPHDIAPTGAPGEIENLLTWNDQGLIPVIAQQHDTGEVLMFAWATREALAKTLATGKATYFSRSRGGLWTKGDTSGYAQAVRTVRTDCDGDCLLVTVDQEGAGACHTGNRTCFYRAFGDGSADGGGPTHS